MKTIFKKILIPLMLFSLIFPQNIAYAATKSVAPVPSEVTITNNVDKQDIIYITGVIGGDTVYVYNAASGGKVIGKTDVSGQKTDATIKISQLGITAGSVYISVKSGNIAESTRTKINYPAELVSEDPLPQNVIITNNVNKADKIYICGLAQGDLVKLYTSDADNGKLLGSARVGSSRTETTISISQLGTNGGSIYASVKSTGMRESSRVKINFPPEGQSQAINRQNVKVTNNSGKSDTIYISGLTSGDKVKIYGDEDGNRLITTASVGSSRTDTTISVSQLGIYGGSIYVSVTSSNMKESDKTKINFSGENQVNSIVPQNVTITNNSGKDDTIYVTGLVSGDKINVYDSPFDGRLLKTAAVSSDGSASVSIGQLGASAGSVYISVTSTQLLESNRVEIHYAAEPKSNILDAGNITVANNAGEADTVHVSGLVEGDIIKVYNSSTGGSLLQTGTVASGASDITVKITQLGIDAGTVYVSLTDENQQESNRIAVNYLAQQKSDAIDEKNITVYNNAGKADTIYISNLTPNDVIKVYDTQNGSNLIGSEAVGSTNTDATISITQLGVNAGSIYVSITHNGKSESSKEKIDYPAEGKAEVLDSNNIIVTNNVGADDTVQVTGVSSGQTVKVYDAERGGNLLGTVTAAAGSTSVTVTISQLGKGAGSVYVSLSDTNKNESDRVKADYSEETASQKINDSDISITNRSGNPDTIDITNLLQNDVIKVYDSLKGGSLLGSGAVTAGDTKVSISITQLGASEGSVYISRKSTDKAESERVKADYLAENKAETLDTNNITVTNNVGADDTVQVTGVSSGQTVKVYDAQMGGNLLGTGTVATNSTSVTITISQLGTDAGSIYVSLTDTNKLESERVKADYSGETSSQKINDSDISITNRSGSADTIDIINLSQNDVIKVYDLAKGGNLLGTATIAAGDTKASISITQLGTSDGSVYISRKSSNKAESERIKADYLAEPKSNEPKAENIIIINNAGIDDTVQVKGLSVKDVINVYDSAKGGSLLGTATAADYATEATVSISQLGTDAGSIYVSITSTNKGESDRTQAGFSAESSSDAPDADKVTIVNNAGIAGTVKVAGLMGGDIVKVYDSAQGGNLLGSGTVETYDTSITISVTQLGSDAGSVFISVTSKGKLESGRIKADYSAKLESNAPSAYNITIQNNSGISDTLEVVGLQPNDTVKVYDSKEGGSLLGTGTASSDNMKAVVTIPQLGIDAGKVYVAVKTSGKTESARTEAAYSAESQSDPLAEGDISIENNAGTSDTVDVTGVSSGDIVKIYSAASGGTALETEAVSSGKSEVTISISQLGTNAGSIYVSVTRTGKTESSRTKADYSAESTAPVEGNIYVINNAVISDTVTVKGLIANDIVKVYDAAQNGNLLGYAIVPANSSETEVTVSQLTANAGSIYVSVTNFGKGESKRTKADYIAEQTSAALYSGNVNIINNQSGTSDVITVINLSPNDVIKVYDAYSGGNLIGTATVSSNENQAVITIPQLSAAAGNVYISVTNIGKNESSRTKVGYVAEK